MGADLASALERVLMLKVLRGAEGDQGEGI